VVQFIKASWLFFEFISCVVAFVLSEMAALGGTMDLEKQSPTQKLSKPTIRSIAGFGEPRIEDLAKSEIKCRVDIRDIHCTSSALPDGTWAEPPKLFDGLFSLALSSARSFRDHWAALC
jgi:hypothetical protein